MPFNLLKKYPELLEILHLNEHQRKKSLMGVYKRDIEDNPNFKFREKQIYPIKSFFLIFTKFAMYRRGRNMIRLQYMILNNLK